MFRKIQSTILSLISAVSVLSMNCASFALPAVSSTTNISGTDTGIDISAAPITDATANAIKEGETYINAFNSSEFSLVSTDSDENYPERYDLRESGLVSPVKYQGNNGTCWAFSSTALLETQLIKNNPLIDLSEWHLSYFNFYGSDTMDPAGSMQFFNAGGHPTFSTSTFAQWIGPVSESVLPYETPADEIDASLKYSSEYHIRDSLVLNSYSNSKVADYNNITLSVRQIKHFLTQGSCVGVNFRYENSYNSKTFAQYSDMKKTPNHSVTIVGWDDSFDRNNFLTAPQNNGAWLCKNSWGDDWADNGFFWISYEDKSLTDTNCMFLEPDDIYEHNYQYDTLAYSASITADNENRNSSCMANIFTAQADEYITAAGLYTTDNNASYEVNVYTDLKDDHNPVSGISSQPTTGTQTYAGYHTITLDTPVAVKKGQKFSVTAKLTNPKIPYPIPVEAAVILGDNKIGINASDISVAKISESSSKGESFISSNGTKWKDTKGIKIENTYENLILDDYSVAYYIGNVCLKAFSSPEGIVRFSRDSGPAAFGDTVELSSDFDGQIYYTTDGSIPDKNSTLYTAPILIDRETDITAALYCDGVMGQSFTKHYTQASSLLSSITVNDTALDLGSLDAPNTDLRYNLDGLNDSVIIFPSGQGKITVNSKEVKSGHDSEPIKMNEGFNKIEISSVEQGKKTTDYTLTVFRNYASVDYKNETIIFNSDAASVSAYDGHLFSSGESISDYLGESLVVKTVDGTYDLRLSRRIDLNQAFGSPSILYSLEAVTSIFSVSGSMLFSSNADMTDAAPISLRKMTVLSDSYFRLFPDTERDLYFQVPASDTSPASTIFHLYVPERPAIDESEINIHDITGTSAAVTINDAVQKRAQYDVELCTSDLDMNKMMIEKFSEDTQLIEDLKPGNTYTLRIRYLSDGEKFASKIACLSFRTLGEFSCCSFDFDKETLLTDDLKYKVTGWDGKQLRCYDSITEYIGTMLYVTSFSGEDTILVEVPARPDVPEIEINNELGRIEYLLDDSWTYVKENEQGYIYSLPSSVSYIKGESGYIWLDDLYYKGFTGNDTLLLRRKATSDSFASEYCAIKIPVCTRIDQSLCSITDYTDTTVSLQYHPGLEYGIKEHYYNSYTWYDTPYFTGLKPSTHYLIAVRYKATPEAIKSQSTYNSITTLASSYIKGDLDDNGTLTMNDCSILKQILLSQTDPDAQQRRASDMNSNSSTNVFDYIRLRRETLG